MWWWKKQLDMLRAQRDAIMFNKTLRCRCFLLIRAQEVHACMVMTGHCSRHSVWPWPGPETTKYCDHQHQYTTYWIHAAFSSLPQEKGWISHGKTVNEPYQCFCVLNHITLHCWGAFSKARWCDLDFSLSLSYLPGSHRFSFISTWAEYETCLKSTTVKIMSAL